MYVLSDMCVRYASLVDPLIPQMAACLKVIYGSLRNPKGIQNVRTLKLIKLLFSHLTRMYKHPAGGKLRIKKGNTYIADKMKTNSDFG